MLPTINNKKERGIDRIAIGSLAIDAYNISKTYPSSLLTNIVNRLTSDRDTRKKVIEST